MCIRLSLLACMCLKCSIQQVLSASARLPKPRSPPASCNSLCCAGAAAHASLSTTASHFLFFCAAATEGMFGVGSDFIEYAAAYRKAAAEAGDSGKAAANGAAVAVNGAGGQGDAPSAPSVPSRPAGFPAFRDFPRDPDGQSSYILLPDAGACMRGWEHATTMRMAKHSPSSQVCV